MTREPQPPENHVVLPHFRLETPHAQVESRARFDAFVQEQVSSFPQPGFSVTQDKTARSCSVATHTGRCGMGDSSDVIPEYHGFHSQH